MPKARLLCFRRPENEENWEWGKQWEECWGSCVTLRGQCVASSHAYLRNSQQGRYRGWSENWVARMPQQAGQGFFRIECPRGLNSVKRRPRRQLPLPENARSCRNSSPQYKTNQWFINVRSQNKIKEPQKCEGGIESDSRR